MSVRRIVGILAPFIFLVATATAAWAHPGFEDPYVPAGRPATLALGVPAETVAPMVGVDIDMPADFTLTRLDQTPGWKSAATPGALHFTITTGSAPLGTYVDFTFAGIFPKKAVLLLPVTTHAQDGTEQQWNGKLTDRWPAAVVFPGYPVGKAPIAGLSTSSTSHAQRLETLAIRVLVLGGALVLIVLALVRRRNRGKRAAARAAGRGGARPSRARGAATAAARPPPPTPAPAPAPKPGSGRPAGRDGKPLLVPKAGPRRSNR